MSVDWAVLCDECKGYHHLGQDVCCVYTFGFDSQDTEGRYFAGKFISDHLAHSWVEYLRIVKTDNIPIGYVDLGDRGV
ncbi:hypothetical protein LCGC14_2790670 [marine sediment metagenome]|uniref:Uncharacterized protein n=1 Tax=marine sediment metagenome TaxID=412755 RepID=A0A0F9BGZ1_9ZZZZ